MSAIVAQRFGRLVVAAASALAACGPAPSQEVATDALSYSVAPALVPAFESATARIRDASGVQLTDDGVTRVHYSTELPPSGLGHGACGLTTTSFKRAPFRVVEVEVELLWPQPPGCDADNTLLHELIHSLRRSLYTREEPLGHSEDGVFAWDIGNKLLTESSLVALCEAVDCSTFVPEEEP